MVVNGGDGRTKSGGKAKDQMVAGTKQNIPDLGNIKRNGYKICPKGTNAHHQKGHK